MLDAERAAGVPATAAEFNDYAAHFARRAARPAPATLTDEQLSEIRREIESLHTRWRELPEGDTLELRFLAETEGRAPSRP